MNFTIIIITVLFLVALYLIYSKQPYIISFPGQSGSYSTKPTFYMRGDRDRTNSRNSYYKIVDSRTHHNLPCGPQISWDVPYEPGYNGVYSDLLWHSISPRMILYDNSLKCNGDNFVSPKPYEENSV